MRKLWLVNNYFISRYNHPARGDYNTEALIFKMNVARFFDVFKEETNKMKENAVALIITWAIFSTTIIRLRLSEYRQISPSTSSRGLFDNIHFAFGE